MTNLSSSASAQRLAVSNPPLIIDSMDETGFRINGQRVEGAILLRPESLWSWSPSSVRHLDSEAFFPVLFPNWQPSERRDPPLANSERSDRDVLLFGNGGLTADRPQPKISEELGELGVGLEIMETRAACRAYTLLVSERRAVAAALIPENFCRTASSSSAELHHTDTGQNL